MRKRHTEAFKEESEYIYVHHEIQLSSEEGDSIAIRSILGSNMGVCQKQLYRYWLSWLRGGGGLHVE